MREKDLLVEGIHGQNLRQGKLPVGHGHSLNDRREVAKRGSVLLRQKNSTIIRKREWPQLHCLPHSLHYQQSSRCQATRANDN